MKRTGLLLLMAVLSGAAHGQTLTCGALKAEASRTASTSRWTVSGPAGGTTETGVLKSGPHFECVESAVLVVEFTSTAGHSVFSAYFPDGTDVSYGRLQVDRRGARYVLPIQAKSRIAAPYRTAFDYHCKLEMPADPIPPAARADCLF